MREKVYQHAKDFEGCEICGGRVSRLDFDSPVYCDSCMAEMERLELSPRKYVKYLELRDSLRKK